MPWLISMGGHGINARTYTRINQNVPLSQLIDEWMNEYANSFSLDDKTNLCSNLWSHWLSPLMFLLLSIERFMQTLSVKMVARFISHSSSIFSGRIYAWLQFNWGPLGLFVDITTVFTMKHKPMNLKRCIEIGATNKFVDESIGWYRYPLILL